jgi:hypothetical protein
MLGYLLDHRILKRFPIGFNDGRRQKFSYVSDRVARDRVRIIVLVIEQFVRNARE